MVCTYLGTHPTNPRAFGLLQFKQTLGRGARQTLGAHCALFPPAFCSVSPGRGEIGGLLLSGQRGKDCWMAAVIPFHSLPGDRYCRETDRRPATYGHGQFACRSLKSLALKQDKVLQTSILFPLARVSRVCMSELSAGFESEARGIFGLPLGVLVRDLKFGIAPAHLCSNSIWHCPPTRAKCAFVSRVPSSREYPTVCSDRLPHSSAGECCSFLRHL